MPSRYSPRFIRTAITLGAVGVCAIIVLAVLLYFQTRSGLLEAHAPKLSEYLALAVSGPGSTQPHLRGKVVTVDTGGRAIDDAMMGLPGELRAMHPNEVTTVVFLRWEMHDTGHVVVRKDRKGKESSKQTVYEYTCEITAVDRDTRQVIAYNRVTSKLNPDRYVVEDRLGGRPVSLVTDFLTSLPRK